LRLTLLFGHLVKGLDDVLREAPWWVNLEFAMHAPQELNASQWLWANRQSWGIENGLHQRLDVSLHDDRCRVRHPSALWILGMFRRLANSLFIEWRSRQPNPQYKHTTAFQSAMGEDNLAKALHFLTCKRPNL
jgi:hypothetical protein